MAHNVEDVDGFDRIKEAPISNLSLGPPLVYAR